MWWCWLGLAFAGGDPDLLPDDDSGAPASGGIGGISMGRANPLPPAPAVPDGRVIRRYGEARWSTGSPITWMAVSPDGQQVLLATRQGAASFDAATGARLALHTPRETTGVAFTAQGEAAWLSEYGQLRVDGGDVRRTGCRAYGAAPLGFTSGGEPVMACNDGVHLPGDAQLALRDARDLSISPDGARIVAWSRHGEAVVASTSGKGDPERLSDVQAAALGPDGRLAIAQSSGIELRVPASSGKKRRKARGGAEVTTVLETEDPAYALAWSPDASMLAATGRGTVRVMSLDGEVRCEQESGPVRALIWAGDHLWWFFSNQTAPTRLRVEDCDVDRPGLTKPVVAAIPAGGLAVTASEDGIATWDRSSGTPVTSASVKRVEGLATPPGDRSVAIYTRYPEPAVVLSLPDLRLLEERARDLSLDHLTMPSTDGGYMPPSRHQVAVAPPGAVAVGLKQLTVRQASGGSEVFELDDHVHFELEDPRRSLDTFGGGRRRRVSSTWDPQRVRPTDLRLTALGWSGDGGRLAMGWEFQVRDAYGEQRVMQWLGVLDPTSRRLAGVAASGRVEAAALSDDGAVIAWLQGGNPVVGRIPAPRPPAPARSSSRSTGALSSGALDAPLQNVLGGPMGDAYGSAYSSKVKRGDAQPLKLEARFSPKGAVGRRKVMALSGDGGRLAVASERELKIWRVGEDEPKATWDTGQGGVRTLSFVDGELWVGGADGTVLVLRVEDL